MVRVPTHRTPTHPGEILLEEFLKPMGLSQRDLADRIRVPYQRVNALVNRRRGITPATALRLARLFGTSPGLWMNLQARWDLYHAEQAEAGALARIRRLAG
jgi:addiction module HigA family antidote